MEPSQRIKAADIDEEYNKLYIKYSDQVAINSALKSSIQSALKEISRLRKVIVSNRTLKGRAINLLNDIKRLFD